MYQYTPLILIWFAGLRECSSVYKGMINQLGVRQFQKLMVPSFERSLVCHGRLGKSFKFSYAPKVFFATESRNTWKMIYKTTRLISKMGLPKFNT
jgi:hypothetical protein